MMLQKFSSLLSLFLILTASTPSSAILSHFFGSGNADNSQSPDNLMKCINDARGEAQGTTWDSVMISDTPASLHALGVFWSKKPSSGIPLTVVTQLSANRVSQLWAQCRNWPGPLSAAIHLTVTQPSTDTLSLRNQQLVKRTTKAISDFHLASERDLTACSLDIILVYEIFTERRAMVLYPVNHLRNLARLQARTELVGLLDVDMLVSTKLAKAITLPDQKNIMINTCKNQAVYVMPAFETYGTIAEAASEADNLSRQSKAFLVQSAVTGIVAPFDSKRFPQGHNTTDFKRWYKTEAQYDLHYTARFEPWIIADRKSIPWHDVRFRGYGQNKIVHVAHVNASGFRFVVHPTAFIIHRAHEVTAARTQLVADMTLYNAAVRAGETHLPMNTIYGKSKTLWDEAKAAMDKGDFVPRQDPVTARCLKLLPWWS